MFGRLWSQSRLEQLSPVWIWKESIHIWHAVFRRDDPASQVYLFVESSDARPLGQLRKIVIAKRVAEATPNHCPAIYPFLDTEDHRRADSSWKILISGDVGHLQDVSVLRSSSLLLTGIDDFRTDSITRFICVPNRRSRQTRLVLGMNWLDDWNDVKHVRCVMVAMCTLLLYEWLILLDREIELIYKARVSFINVCYILCRYYTAAAWIILMWCYVGDHPKELCTRVVRPVHAILAPCQFTSQGVMLMRAYAFTSRSRQVLLILGLCYLFLVGFNIGVFCAPVDILEELYTVLGSTGCFPDFGDGFMGRRVGYSIFASTLMDFISLLVVSIQCYRTQARDVSLGRYVENQGLLGFALVCIINLTCTVIYFQLSDGTGLPMTLVLPNLVACRLILQLRQRCQPLTETELDARNSRIVRDAFDRLQVYEDSWTMS
ncbi:hypothetical protein Agabi119p4_6260 [Agaricus bisporus var. burnettii]|uniref:DUF6533 domain-containing protein n=1 Tax=Agaricus bisporus var. burnettii TaxID=192524 RepID=A0A8H7EZG1_AGABI|nr:hypothetical protein Agabi119p4_6260 [Agaricus bisporus var. burnettii]